ncbi:MAG TPA: hypothetical protein ENH25_11025 [candidate division Zixibacteria bacterium]|nr:hypothetical protein [candidate division Zixibacteria bacterium]
MSNGAFVATSAATTAAAAAHAAKMRDEEENMTGYNKEDLNGWEFKIVRSSMGTFSNYEKVQEVCRQEAKAGWELVEKFDQYRLRFKRRTDMRSKDQFLDIDPYRTNVGGGGKTVGIIVGLSIFFLGAFIFLVMYLKNQHIRIEPTGIVMIIISVGILVLLISLIASRFGRSSRPKGPKTNY